MLDLCKEETCMSDDNAEIQKTSSKYFKGSWIQDSKWKDKSTLFLWLSTILFKNKIHVNDLKIWIKLSLRTSEI